MPRRISWLVLATTSTVVVSFIVPLCLLVRTTAEDRAMAEVDQEARNIAILVASLDGQTALANVVSTLDSRAAPSTAVLTDDGRVLGSGDVSVDDPEVVRARNGEAFTVVDDRGGRVLLPVVTGDGTVVVHTSTTVGELRQGVLAAWLGIVGLGLVLLGLAAAVAARLGRRISEPLREVATAAHRLREGDLAARAEARGTEETMELAHALNGLAERVHELLTAERAAVADLSHRLRTPVTALRLDADLVRDDEGRERLLEHISVLQRSIDAIVREARRPVRTDLAARCDAVAVVRDRVEHWQALAEDQGRGASSDLVSGPLTVAVAADDLADVVDILVDNVFAHTAELTPFEICLDAVDGHARLLVVDEGGGPRGEPGDRPGTSGIGLDIARRTAEAAGGSLLLEQAPAGGTRVEVRLPIRDD